MTLDINQAGITRQPVYFGLLFCPGRQSDVIGSVRLVGRCRKMLESFGWDAAEPLRLASPSSSDSMTTTVSLATGSLRTANDREVNTHTHTV